MMLTSSRVNVRGKRAQKRNSPFTSSLFFVLGEAADWQQRFAECTGPWVATRTFEYTRYSSRNLYFRLMKSLEVVKFMNPEFWKLSCPVRPRSTCCDVAMTHSHCGEDPRQPVGRLGLRLTTKEISSKDPRVQSWAMLSLIQVNALAAGCKQGSCRLTLFLSAVFSATTD